MGIDKRAGQIQIRLNGDSRDAQIRLDDIPIPCYKVELSQSVSQLPTVILHCHAVDIEVDTDLDTEQVFLVLDNVKYRLEKVD